MSKFEQLLQVRIECRATESALTKREREVLDLLLLGRNALEMSKVMVITPRTVKFHQANVLRKIGADSRCDLLRVLITGDCHCGVLG